MSSDVLLKKYSQLYFDSYMIDFFSTGNVCEKCLSAFFSVCGTSALLFHRAPTLPVSTLFILTSWPLTYHSSYRHSLSSVLRHLGLAVSRSACLPKVVPTCIYYLKLQTQLQHGASAIQIKFMSDANKIILPSFPLERSECLAHFHSFVEHMH